MQYAEKEADLIVLNTASWGHIENKATMDRHVKEWHDNMMSKIVHNKGKLTKGWYTRVIATIRKRDAWGLVGWDANNRRSWVVILSEGIDMTTMETWANNLVKSFQDFYINSGLRTMDLLPIER
jgi:hypothetical protein